MFTIEPYRPKYQCASASFLNFRENDPMTEFNDAVRYVTVFFNNIADSVHLRSLSGSDERIFEEFIVRKSMKDVVTRTINKLFPDLAEGSSDKLAAIALAAFEDRLAELGNTANIRGNA